MTLRTLNYGNYGIFLINYGNYGIFLIMDNAGFCPSTVSTSIASFWLCLVELYSLLVGYHWEPKVKLFHNIRII